MSSVWQKPKLYKGIVTSENTMVFQEIPNFKQSDLRQDSVFVLDLGDELFIWIGDDVTETQRKVTFNIHTHLIPLKEKYHKNWFVIMTKQGLEPEMFKKSFGEWEPELLVKLRENVEVEEEKYDALNFNEIDD